MTYESLTVETRDSVCIITLNRPEKRNALDMQMLADIRSAFGVVRTDRTIHSVILTGAGGKAFASGADIRTLQQRGFLDTLYSDTHTIFNEIEATGKPVIAAIDGFALGGGCELVMSCDIRIATARSKLGQPEVNLGLIPGAGGTQRLQRLVGIGKAKELIFTGAIIDAAEAQRIGLVNKVVEDPADLIPAALEMANMIHAKGPMAITMAKMVINAGASTDLNSGLLMEKLAQTILFGTEDRKEGTTAFLEKRSAKFKGC
ncbi:enoyl-CoA hydratase/isomerase family protein [Desulfosarcina sp. OttesenSCG-928-A07]|nr:enoyl-CoA hydratase/isomerase family protein [Desulfosarcina sp. OttesenSCG-928-G17]MDL2328982.1 enoyl-CoA hydratase/isomerase family protein [Desulfosarcina sp. OttesenSCG-928-A07]